MKESNKWYKSPVEHLEKTFGGDAGFVPLALSFPLAERLLTFLIQKDGKTKSAIPEYLSKTFSVNLEIADTFWKMYRDGMMHCAQPYNGKIKGENGWGWDISDNYQSIPHKFESAETGKVIRLNPWKWFYHVVDICSNYTELDSISDLRKIGGIQHIQEIRTENFSENYNTHQNQTQIQSTQTNTGVCFPQNQ